jgi:hypothetical protein
MNERNFHGDPGKKPVNGNTGNPPDDYSKKSGYRDYDPGQDDFDEDFNDVDSSFLDDDFDEFGEEDDDYDDDFEDGLFDEDEDELRSEEHGVPRSRLKGVARHKLQGRLPRADGPGKRARRMRFLSPEALRHHHVMPEALTQRESIHRRSRLSVLLNSRAALRPVLR